MIDKDRFIKEFLSNLLEKLSPDTKDLILKQLDSRIDDECKFFLRFDKQKLLEEDYLWLTDKGDCYHIAVTVAAFPAKKER